MKISVGGFSYVPATYTFNINSEVNIPAPVFNTPNPPTVTSYTISPALLLDYLFQVIREQFLAQLQIFSISSIYCECTERAFLL